MLYYSVNILWITVSLPSQFTYCTEPTIYNTPDSSDEQLDPLRPEGTAGAFVHKTRIWKGHDALMVYFYNPDYLKQGKYPLSIDTVMAWAEAWNTAHAPNIPKFEKTYFISKADIRVLFGGKNCFKKSYIIILL